MNDVRISTWVTIRALGLGAGLLVSGLLDSPPVTGQQMKTSAWSVAEGENLTEVDGKIQLKLEEAIAIALERNLGLRVERYSRTQSHYGVQLNKGIFDFNVGAQGLAFDETSPAASNLVGAPVFKQSQQSLDLSLNRLLPVGGVAAVEWNNRRSESNSFFASVNPSFTVDFDLVYSQPLLRNLGKLATERNLLVARTNSAISFSDFEVAVNSTVQLVENTYWTLVEARQQLKVAEQGLELAKELHEMNRIQVEVGTLAPLELIQSEVGIATRQEEIIRARAAVEDAADLLRRFLNVDSPRLWSMEIEPVTDPEIDRVTIDLDKAMESALATRPEMERQLLVLDNLELDTRYYRNLARPRLDAQVSYGWNGLGGNVRVRDPDSDPLDPNAPVTIFPGGYDDALDQIRNRDFEGWRFLLDFGYPIQNRAAKARRTIADLALERGETQLDDLETQIRTEVRTTARGVETAAQQIDSARVSMRLAEENLDAERKRYENGLSTSFQVLEIQDDLTQARSRLVNAITGYRRALVRYYRSIGRLLDENGIEIEDEFPNSDER